MSESITFESLNLEAHLLDRLDALGYEFATPVQAMAIPPAVEGKDVLATARTGTGKTAAFVLPILQTHKAGVIICPTRELALQVVNEIERLSGLDNIATALIGGASMKKQIQQLNEWPEAILVATPGRICDHMERGNVDLDQYEVLVLDEADEMLSMGFAEDLEYIVDQMNPEHQTLLFSATMPKHVQKLSNKILNEPERIQASGKEERPPSLVQQFVMVCTLRERVDAIEKLLLAWQPNAAIIFCKTRNRVETVADILRPKGAEALHGGMSQAERTRVMNRFREGRTNVLVATDVAARGIDVDRVDLVIQDDLPTDDDIYIHRVGRTGRAGRTGRSVLMVGNRAVRHIKRIEKKAGALERMDIPTQQDIDHIQRAQLVEEFTEVEPQQNAIDTFNEAVASGLSAEKIAIAALSKLLHSSQEKEKSSTPQVNKSDNGPKAALVLGLGAMDGIDRGSITGMVYRVGNLPDASVGRIEMLDKITAVELPEEFIDQLVQDLEQERVGRRYVRPRRSDDWTFQPEGRHPSQRRHGGGGRHGGGRQGGGRKGPGGRHNSRGNGRSGRQNRRR
ncbi:MAG TPA: DEAD/DEAH box helicase [Candidatus Poseidoniales archaeon]|nr:MAG TPA: DEAD/DEAH box helicase [Candidatus Poseidoniales archaeon]